MFKNNLLWSGRTEWSGGLWFETTNNDDVDKIIDNKKMKNVSAFWLTNIDSDYDGVMGVPISFLDKYCPEQFEIKGLDRYVDDNPKYGHRFTINQKETYARILIYSDKEL